MIHWIWPLTDRNSWAAHRSTSSIVAGSRRSRNPLFCFDAIILLVSGCEIQVWLVDADIKDRRDISGKIAFCPYAASVLICLLIERAGVEHGLCGFVAAEHHQ